jgi:hypothetical protein
MPLLMFLWAAAATAVFVALLFVRPRMPRHLEIWVVAATGAALHIVPIVMYPDPQGSWITDIRNFALAGQRVLDGLDVYALARIIPYHPYPPFQMYVFAVAYQLADWTSLSFFTLMRLPQSAANVGTAVLIVLALRRTARSNDAFRSGLLYATCPFPMLVTTYHGQFDAISAFFTVAALFLLAKGEARARDGSAVALALGILQKMWPAFLGLVILGSLRSTRSAVRYVAICGTVASAFVLAYIFVFESRIGMMRDRIVGYESPFPTAGGIVLVLDRLPNIIQPAGLPGWWNDNGAYVAIAGVVAVSAFVTVRRVEIFAASAAVMCVVFLLFPDPSAYHLVWPLPLGLLAGHRLPVALIALFASALFLHTGYLGGGLFWPPVDGPGTDWLLERYWVMQLAIWLAFLGWLGWILWSVSRRPHLAQAAAASSDTGTSSQIPASSPRL